MGATETTPQSADEMIRNLQPYSGQRRPQIWEWAEIGRSPMAAPVAKDFFATKTLEMP